MRKIMILKTLVDIVWIVSILTLVVFALSVFVSLLSGEVAYNDITDTDSAPIYLYPFLIMIIYKFRKIVYHFLRNRLFDEVVISNMNKIGILFITCGFINMILPFIKNLIEGTFMLQFDPIGSTSMYFITGLFFMILSEIFKISKAQQEENKLTI